jgi:anti-sigma factor RsiW
LDASEDAEVAAHLSTCAACRGELGAIAALPQLMGQLSLEDIEGVPPQPSEELFDRLREQAARVEERPTRWTRGRRLMAVAAAAVILAGGAVGISAWATGGGSPPAYSATAGHVRMRVELATQARGTGIRVSVAGLPEDEHCRLIAIGDDGSSDLAGTWTATYGGDAQVTGSTSIARSRLRQLILLGTAGQQLVAVSV